MNWTGINRFTLQTKLKTDNKPWLYLVLMRTSFSEIIEHLWLASLNTFSVSLPKPWGLQSDFIEACRDLGCSKLSTLYLGSSPLPISKLSLSLALLSSIQCLSLGILFLGAKEEGAGESNLFQPNMTLSPACTGNLLGSFKHTLVNLRLWKDWYGTAWDAHDRSRLDLSSFEMLRTLTLPSDCLIVFDFPNPSREGLWKTLPVSLEDLKIRAWICTHADMTGTDKGRPEP